MKRNKIYSFTFLIFIFIVFVLFLTGCSNSNIASQNLVDEKDEVTSGIIKLNVTDEKSAEEVNPQTIIPEKPISQTKNVGERIIIDHTTTNLEDIPESCITKAKENLHIAYTHTSHGSQLVSGMEAVKKYNSFYDLGSKFNDYGGFSGACPDLSQCDGAIASPTKKFLDNSDNKDVNVIMWSWCDIGGHNIDKYLEDMQTLISEYEDGSSKHSTPVKFVFMTGHANGGGEGDSSDSQNKKIRDFFYDDSKGAFCETHECILFDFSDIENYNPDGKYFLDKKVTDALNYDGGNWGTEYLKKYPSSLNAELTDLVSGCAHSDGSEGSKLNCALKGQAAWYMYARMAGWDGKSKSCN